MDLNHVILTWETDVNTVLCLCYKYLCCSMQESVKVKLSFWWHPCIINISLDRYVWQDGEERKLCQHCCEYKCCCKDFLSFASNFIILKTFCFHAFFFEIRIHKIEHFFTEKRYRTVQFYSAYLPFTSFQQREKLIFTLFTHASSLLDHTTMDSKSTYLYKKKSHVVSVCLLFCEENASGQL